MKVFISYGNNADQVTALRLQALGAVSGLTVYVPPSHTRLRFPPQLGPEVDQRLHEAEVVLGIVGTFVTAACGLELEAGLRLGKNMIVMSDPACAPHLRPDFGSKLIEVDPAQPDRAEIEIVQHLEAIKGQQTAKKALLALGTLALGLLLLAPADQD